MSETPSEAAARIAAESRAIVEANGGGTANVHSPIPGIGDETAETLAPFGSLATVQQAIATLANAISAVIVAIERSGWGSGGSSSGQSSSYPYSF